MENNLARILMRKSIKGVPLGALVLIGLLVSGISAALIMMFWGQATVTVSVSGVAGRALQCGTQGYYTVGQSLTTLQLQTYGPMDATVYKFNGKELKAAMLVVDKYQIPVDKTLKLKISVYIGNPSTGGVPVVNGWTAYPQFVSFYRLGGDGAIGFVAGNILTSNGDGTWTISYAKIEDMKYVPADGGTVGDANCLLIGFEFAPLYDPSYDTIDTTRYVKLEVSVDTGGA